MHPAPPNLYRQLLSLLRQHSHYRDLRHLKTLAWMVTALIACGKLSLPSWEPYVLSPAQNAQSYERRWKRLLLNPRIDVIRLYLPLLLAAISTWKTERVYLALDTTVLWNRFCMIHLSLVCGERAVPLLWKVIEHPSAAIEFSEYRSLLRKAEVLLRDYSEVMLLADRGFANQDLLRWLKSRRWHWAIRLPCDVLVSGPCTCPMEVRALWPALGQGALVPSHGKTRSTVSIELDGISHC